MCFEPIAVALDKPQGEFGVYYNVVGNFPLLTLLARNVFRKTLQ